MALRLINPRNRTRPAGRPVHTIDRRPPQRRPDFDVLFDELLHARSRYEDLRISDGPADDRIASRERLHALRASMASARTGLL